MTNAKLLTAAGALLLLATAITPSAVGHDDRWLCPNPIPYPNLMLGKATCTSPPAHRYPLTYGGNHVETGVAGTYVGATGPAYAPDAYNFPNNAQTAGIMGCDFEVVVDAQNDPSNEQVIDGSPAAGNQPDGTWDDGGQGGACHFRTYVTAKHNTPGCPGDRSVRGTNFLGGDIWVAATCDYKELLGGTTPQVAFELCLINNVLSQNVPGLVGCVVTFVDCVTDWTCQSTGATENCGSDNSIDAVDFGYGWGTAGAIANFPAVGAAYNWPMATACLPAHAVESIFVFDAVTTMGGTYIDPDGAGPLPRVFVPNATTTVNVYPALSGQVWTVTP